MISKTVICQATYRLPLPIGPQNRTRMERDVAWCWRRLGPVFIDRSEHTRPRMSAAPATEPDSEEGMGAGTEP